MPPKKITLKNPLQPVKRIVFTFVIAGTHVKLSAHTINIKYCVEYAEPLKHIIYIVLPRQSVPVRNREQGLCPRGVRPQVICIQIRIQYIQVEETAHVNVNVYHQTLRTN